MRIREARKHTDPTERGPNADSEHWCITSFFKNKSHKEVTKQYKSRFFLLFFIDDDRIRIRIRTCDQLIRMRIREVQKHKDPQL